MQPDPPLQLTWTLLNQSVTGTYSDIMLSWKPPESADVEMGWLRLQYEVQYRRVEVEQWQQVGTRPFGERKHQRLGSLLKAAVFICSPQADLVRSTYRTLYGLQTNVEYEVRVRCKTLAGKAFGDFGDSVFVHILSKGKDSAVRQADHGCLCGG